MADKLTYYEILGVSRDSSEKEITKAYRKKALKCHPDKNPDDPAAVELFHELSKALEVLTDLKAKAAYDAVLKAKERARLRTQALDAKRKKFKQDLEQREDAARVNKENDEMAAKNLQAEIERLREEGSKFLQEQQELLKQQLNKEKEGSLDKTSNQDVAPKLKYGEVSYVIVSSKKKGSAIVEFKSLSSAKVALENEQGTSDNPLKISWLEVPTSATDKANSETVPEASNSAKEAMVESKLNEPPCPSESTISDKDYESIVLMKLRQFEERKRLIKEMQEEDES
ncbi:dnaJ homolog subfamily C member 17-like isoform X2 [Porites lutea]|uniref:dnaJ homolog subfamily C member 17-like isoform X2 n=1 Tax=Porites lutea TaxID=51062 RepID=UPI003CC660A0